MAKKPSNMPNLAPLPKRAIEDVSRLVRGREHLSTVAEASAKVRPAASVLELSTKIAAQVGLDPEVVAELVTGIWALKSVQTGWDLDADGVVDRISRSLELQASLPWKLAEWQETVEPLKAALRGITDDHPLLISAKANSLAYTHQNLFINARLITDVRPVFDSNAENIVETVITHSMAVYYREGSGDEKLMTFALDRRDLESLREQLERAEKKAAAAKKAFRDFNPVILAEGE